ncbi:MAG TPA: filamentous hemagglutinin N-terminal domain-containing protein, partial [Gammaproteobacteria bacterium]
MPAEHAPRALRATESPLAQAVRRVLRPGGWALAALAAPGWLAAAPQGGQVVAGDLTIAQPDRLATTITQATQRGAIDWRSFSIAGDEYVEFVQPGRSAVTLNRVVGSDPSALLGRLTANGQVFLVNPQGVYFGQDAVVDVAGLVATTFAISNEDFLAGRYEFSRAAGTGGGTVVNDGSLTAEGGYVVLAGPDGVANGGLIEARLGTVLLAAGERLTLDLSGDGLVSFALDGDALGGVENSGTLLADGGRVFLAADVAAGLVTTAVNQEGLVRARTVEERDGVIYLGGAGADVVVSGTLDADAGEADADGGRV